MARILLTLLIIFSFGFMANAQFSKGSILLGGQLFFSSSKISDPVSFYQNQKNNTGNFSVSIGKAIKENAVFGVTLSYNSTSTNNISLNNGTVAADYSRDSYTIALFYRIYKTLGKDFYLFGEAGGGYIGASETGKDQSGNKQLTGTGSGGNLYFMPGISYQVSKKFLLELTMPTLFNATYITRKATLTGQEPSKTDLFGISTSLSANPLNSLAIGFRLVL